MLDAPNAPPGWARFSDDLFKAGATHGKVAVVERNGYSAADSEHLAEGVPVGSVGYIIGKYPDGAFEVEFSDPASGQNWATIVAFAGDLSAAPEQSSAAD